MIGQLIDRYKQHKKHRFLSQYDSYEKGYAFVGVGGHSLSNLYPVIDHLGLPLKYIYSRKLSNASSTAIKYKNTVATNQLEDILHDNTVEAVFICAHPSVHFELSKKCLKAGKHVFVEKPPCATENELDELISLSKQQTSLVGFQKRYSAIAEILKKVKGVTSYQYQYHTGGYPEGNAILDLFIHPIDLCIYLFGAINKHHIIEKNNTIFIQAEHQNGIVGQLSLSTAYSWSNPKETIEVNTQKGFYISENSNRLTLVEKSSSVLGIPLEKIARQPVVKKELLNSNGFIPLAEHNSLTTQGYYGEIKAFVDAVEKNQVKTPSDFQSLKNTFSFIDQLND